MRWYFYTHALFFYNIYNRHCTKLKRRGCFGCRLVQPPHSHYQTAHYTHPVVFCSRIRRRKSPVSFFFHG